MTMLQTCGIMLVQCKDRTTNVKAEIMKCSTKPDVFTTGKFRKPIPHTLPFSPHAYHQ